MLSFRATTIVLLWKGVLLAAAIPASGQCEVQEAFKLTASDAAANDFFGYSVAVSGDMALIGAYRDDHTGGGDAGSAYVFARSGEVWTQQQKLTASDAAAGDDFGYDVAVDGDTAVIGAFVDDHAGGTDAGSAYVFLLTDCNDNSIADECDISNCAGDPACGDCNTNGIPDECDIAVCPPNDPACQDCNRNNVPDECDITGGDSNDIDGNGVPDDCYQPPMGEPFGVDKNRYLSLSVPPPMVGSGPLTALRVTLVDLQNPVPPNLPQFPPPNFSAYESQTCTAPLEASGCIRWVGMPGTFLESQDDPSLGNFRGARLQCTPYYYPIGGEGLIHVTGAEIVPSSKYDVQTLASFCMGQESSCTAVSTPLRINTARSGDVEVPFNPPSSESQPNVTDIAQLVNKVKSLAGAPVKAIAQLQPNLPELNTNINVSDIVAVVDGVKLFKYAYSGPCPCPSLSVCGALGCASDTACRNSALPGLGAGAVCVRTCTGPGPLAGEPCIDNAHCVGSGTCGAGFCRDRCGRCTPP